MTILFWGKNPKQLELASSLYTGVGDDSDDNLNYEDSDWGGDDFDGNDGGEDDYDDCDQGANDFDDNDGAVAGADRKLKPAVANDFCFSIQFCKQPALELPQNRWPMWQTPQRHCGQSTPGWWWRCHDYCD